MSKAVEAQEITVDLNIVETVTIKTKKHGNVMIYKILPCKYYSKIELMLFAMNNPKYVIYDSGDGSFYVNDFARTFLLHTSRGVFYARFLNAFMKRKLGEPYHDACQKYLRRYVNSKA